MNKKKIAILGAGPSGLAQLRAFEAARLAGVKGTSENLSLLLSFSENDSKTQKNS